jgi:hypothetical protein
MEAIFLQVAGMGPSEKPDLLLQDAGDRAAHKKWNGIASLTVAILNDEAGEVRGPSRRVASRRRLAAASDCVALARPLLYIRHSSPTPTAYSSSNLYRFPHTTS